MSSLLCAIAGVIVCINTTVTRLPVGAEALGIYGWIVEAPFIQDPHAHGLGGLGKSL